MAKFRLFGSKTDEVSDRELVNRRLARTVAAEGMVLLKNDGVLPLQSKRLALFGAGARMTVKGGTGSGNMQERYSVSIEEGLKMRALRLFPPAGLTVSMLPMRRKRRHGVGASRNGLSTISPGRCRGCLMRLSM